MLLDYRNSYLRLRIISDMAMTPHDRARELGIFLTSKGAGK